MKIATSLLTLVFCMGLLAAQPGHMGMGSMPPARASAVPPLDQLKTYLTLSDAQVTKLQDVQKTWRDTAQPLMEQVGAKTRELREAMRENPVVPSKVDALKAELDALQKKVQVLRDQYQPQALAVLSTQQQSLLATLQKVLELIPAAQQAAFVNLIDNPQGSGPMGFPGGGGRGGTMGGPRYR